MPIKNLYRPIGQLLQYTELVVPLLNIKVTVTKQCMQANVPKPLKKYVSELRVLLDDHHTNVITIPFEQKYFDCCFRRAIRLPSPT